MKRTILTIILLSILVAGIIADESNSRIAYRFLDDFVTTEAIKAQNAKKTGASITMGLGIALMSVAGGLYFWGDELLWSPGVWTPETRDITCLSLLAGGTIMTVTGSIILATPMPDYKAKYAFIYEEEDPVVQEALAAAALYDMAEIGKRGRIISGITDIATPVLSIAIVACANLFANRTWYENTEDTFYSLSWNLVSGFSKLFIDKSEEERLYEKYEHAREALLVSND